MRAIRCAAACFAVGWVTGCESTPDSPAPDADAAIASPADADASVAAPARKEDAQPPPLAGGTLAVTPDGATAVAADPDTDRILVVNLARRAVIAALDLRAGDEPGRVALGDGGRAFVALRGGGAVVTVDLAAGAITERRPVCSHPRGLAWDPARERLHVACMGGELVSLPAVGVEGARRALLDRDLRDVVVVGDRVAVSRLRSAELLLVDDRGVVTQRIPDAATPGAQVAVARRMVAAPDGVWLLHQEAGAAPVTVSTAGYYTSEVSCAGTEGVTRPALTRVRLPGGLERFATVPNAALAVDLAASRDGASVALAIPGAWGSPHPQVVIVERPDGGACVTPRAAPRPARGQVVALAFAPGDRLVVQTRAPAALFLGADGDVPLGGPEVRNEGHTLFHTNPTGTVACASCHVEGEDDGRVWNFAPAGPRRTPHLRGGILGTEPFHWSGDLRDLGALVESVMVNGMRAPRPSAEGIDSLARWIDRLPRRAAPAADPAAVARGEALFRGEETACATCHAGPHFTNGATVDVGTGAAFQVPALHGLAWRAPFMHDGCAATLRDRFGACGGGDRHGRTSHLSSAQVGDLVAYLETL